MICFHQLIGYLLLYGNLLIDVNNIDNVEFLIMCFRIILLLRSTVTMVMFMLPTVLYDVNIRLYMNFLDICIRCDVGMCYVMNNDVMFYLLCVYLI